LQRHLVAAVPNQTLIAICVISGTDCAKLSKRVWPLSRRLVAVQV
jgi:hypothetical protein